MPELKWDTLGERYYETGVSNAAIYVKNASSDTYQSGISWSGVISVNDQLETDDPEPLLDHGIPYFYSYGLSRPILNVAAYTYPEELLDCLGYEQEAGYPWKIPTDSKQLFGFTYKSLIGNDSDGNDRAYKLHLFYNCMITPGEESQFGTVTNEIEPMSIPFIIYPASFKMTVNGVVKALTHLVFDSRWFESSHGTYKLDRLCNYLYGKKDGNPSFPAPDQIGSILGNSYYDT